MGQRKSKRKQNTDPRTRSRFMTAGLIGFTLLVGVFLFVNERGSPVPEPPTRERVIVPFDEINPTATSNLYSGMVRLNISGTGQAAGNDWSDAFYQYTQNGNRLKVPLTEHFDLEIDGDRAIYALELLDDPPPYNPDHEYTVSYDVGSEPRTIEFRVSDSNVDDNSGQFEIEVIQQ